MINPPGLQLLDKLRQLTSCPQVHHYRAGEIILSAEEPTRQVYFVNTGFVSITSISMSGRETLHGFFQAGDFFPMNWFVDTSKKQQVVSQFYYQALTNVTILQMHALDCCQIINSRIDLLQLTVKELMHILNLWQQRLNCCTSRNGYTRVISSLYVLAQNYGQQTDDGIMVTLPITHQLLANSLALSRETVTRIIDDLRKQGFVECQRGHMLIHNLQKLMTEKEDRE